MKLTKQEVENVAKLARLSIGEEEKEQFSQQISSILAYVGKLNELDTSNIEPTSHVLPIQNVMRADEVRLCLPREKGLANAPERKEGWFRVPKIIEGRE